MLNFMISETTFWLVHTTALELVPSCVISNKNENTTFFQNFLMDVLTDCNDWMSAGHKTKTVLEKSTSHRPSIAAFPFDEFQQSAKERIGFRFTHTINIGLAKREDGH